MKSYHNPKVLKQKKILMFIGQAPARTANGHCTARIASMLGHERFRWVNLLQSYPGKSGKGDAFDLKMARCAAVGLENQLRGSVAVLLGHNVAAAFHVRGDYFTEHEQAGIRFVIFPHPSAVNQFWNSKLNTLRAARYLRKLAHTRTAAKPIGIVPERVGRCPEGEYAVDHR